MDAQPKKAHLAFLDGLRALAACYVMLGHAVPQIYFTHTQTQLFPRLIVHALNLGHFAVSMFIMLSGFCLVLPVIKARGVLRSGALEFFRRRAHRILPPYAFTLALSLILVQAFINHKTGTLWDKSIPVTGMDVITHLLLVHDLFQQSALKINGPLWSIAVEWRIYFLFPIIVLLWRRFSPLKVTLVMFVFTELLAKVFGHIFKQTFLIQYFGLFSVGMLAAHVAYDEQIAPKLSNVRWDLIAVPIVVVWLYMVDVKLAYTAFSDIPFALIGFCLLVHAARPRPNRLTAFLSWKPLAFMGTFSYSIYLIHMPLMQIFWQYAFTPLEHKPAEMFFSLVLIAIPIIVCISYGFHICFERPFMNTKPKTIAPLVEPVETPEPSRI